MTDRPIDSWRDRMIAALYGELSDDEMREFEKKIPHFTYVPTIARPGAQDNWQGETGLVTAALDRHVSDCSKAEAYLCGSPAMIDACVKVLTAKGMPTERIFYDKFA